MPRVPGISARTSVTPMPAGDGQRPLIARRSLQWRRPGSIAPWSHSRRHSSSRGVSAVEFALIGPTAFLLLIGAVVLGIVVTHEIQLTQAVRDGARAAAICGSSTDQGTGSTLPDGTLCTTANLTTYINARVDAVSPALANHAVVTVFSPS